MAKQIKKKTFAFCDEFFHWHHLLVNATAALLQTRQSGGYIKVIDPLCAIRYVFFFGTLVFVAFRYAAIINLSAFIVRQTI